MVGGILGLLAIVEMFGGVKTIIEAHSEDYPEKMAAGAMILLLGFIVGAASLPTIIGFILAIAGIVPGYNKAFLDTVIESLSD